MRLFPDLTQQEEFYQLGNLGYTGTLNDRQYKYLDNSGFTGTLGDKMAQWRKGLSKYAIQEDGISYIPLFVFDATTQQALKRDFELYDYAVIEDSESYSPLFVWDAHNQVAIK